MINDYHKNKVLKDSEHRFRTCHWYLDNCGALDFTTKNFHRLYIASSNNGTLFLREKPTLKLSPEFGGLYNQQLFDKYMLAKNI